MRHKPTGLFFCLAKEIKITVPDGGKIAVMTNLDTKGRLYNNIPTFAWIGSQFKTHIWNNRDYELRDKGDGYRGRMFYREEMYQKYMRYSKQEAFIFDDWELVEVKG